MGTFNVQKQDGGLNRQAPRTDYTSALVMGAVAATGLAIGTLSDELSRVEDAEDLGIDAIYDVANDVLVHYHIKEYFRMNPNGKLRVLLVAQGTSLEDMCDKTNSYVQKVVDDTNGKVRRIGVVLNPASGYVSVTTGALDDDSIAAIPKAQELAEAAYTAKRPVQILIEGREFNGTVAAADDLRNLDDEYACVTIIQDPGAVTNFSLHEKSAAVGTTLGAMSAASPNLSIGWTGKFNLSGDNGEFASVNLSSNALASTVEADFETLTQKGYIYGRNYPSQEGVYFDAFPSCALITSDYAYGQEVAVMNEATRKIYAQLFPRINGPIKIDPDTGKIDPEVAKEIEADGSSSLDIMVQDDQISGKDAYVDPDQDVQTSGELIFQFSIVSIATGRKITAKIGFTKSLG